MGKEPVLCRGAVQDETVVQVQKCLSWLTARLQCGCSNHAGDGQEQCTQLRTPQVKKDCTDLAELLWSYLSWKPSLSSTPPWAETNEKVLMSHLVFCILCWLWAQNATQLSS